MKTLIIENLDHLEERIASYLVKHPRSETQIVYQVARKSQAELVEIFTDPELGEFLFESSLTDRDQFFDILNLLIQLKDVITFRKITILYLLKEFEVFLNTLCVQEPRFKDPLLEVFEIYKIYGIEYNEYEDNRTKRDSYFRNIKRFFTCIRINVQTFSDGDCVFLYETTPFIDPRAESRTHALISFEKSFITGSLLKDFFDETTAFLDYQEELIESSKEKERDELLDSNRKRKIALAYLKASFEVAKIEIN